MEWGIRVCFALSLFLSGVPSFATVSAKSTYNQLPRGSTLTLLAKDLWLSPGETAMTAGMFDQDSDGDGVADSTDWCPSTPPSAKVFTAQDVKAGRCRQMQIGCTGEASDKALDGKTRTTTPHGRSILCTLLALSSADDRPYPNGTVLSVIDPRDASVTKEEREELATSTVAGERHTRVYRNLLLSTPGGTHLGLACRAFVYFQARISKEEEFYTGAVSSGNEVTIAELEKFATLTIAKPVPIP